MAYDRYPRAGDRGGYSDRNDLSDYGQDFGGDRYGSNERGFGGDGDRYRRDENRDDGRRDYGNQAYGQRERGGFTGGRDYYRGDQPQRAFGGDRDRDRGYDPYRQQRGTYDRQPQNYRDEDRGFVARAGDEVRSWFGDEEAERRREEDARRDEPTGFRASYGADPHYNDWRNQQIAAFDRDYHEYRQENRSKFHDEFASFRSERQGQRDLLGRVEEHAEVTGSDGAHIGTVDKVRGDRIILTRSDPDAGGHHHSIPSRWLQSVDGNKVTVRKTAVEAKAHWRDEERNAMFGDDRSDAGRRNEDGSSTGGTNLDRSFSGTY